LQIVATIRSAEGQTVSEETRAIVVPDMTRATLGITSPTVVVARNPAELKTLSTNTVPFAGREFVRTDRLFVRFAVFGAAASRANVSARLLSRSGSVLLTLETSRSADAPGACQIDLPLASIARGDYVIAVAAEAGDDRAEALVPLRVSGG